MIARFQCRFRDPLTKALKLLLAPLASVRTREVQTTGLMDVLTSAAAMDAAAVSPGRRSARLEKAPADDFAGAQLLANLSHAAPPAPRPKRTAARTSGAAPRTEAAAELSRLGWNPDTPLKGWQVDGVKFQNRKAQKGELIRAAADGDVRRQVEEVREWLRLSGRPIEAALSLAQTPQATALMWPDITRNRMRGYTPAAKEGQDPKKQAKSRKLLDTKAELEMVDRCVQELRQVAAGAVNCKACAGHKGGSHNVSPALLRCRPACVRARVRVRPADSAFLRARTVWAREGGCQGADLRQPEEGA